MKNKTLEDVASLGMYTVKVPDPNNPGKMRSISLSHEQILALESGITPPDTRFGLPASPLFADLDELAIIEIGRRGRQRHLSAGSTVFAQGEFADAVYFVIKGRVRSTTRDRHGRNWSFFDLATATPGELFGCEAIVSDIRPQTATAVEDAVVLQVNRDEFRDLLKLYPQLAVNFSLYNVDRLNRCTERFAQFSGAFTAQKIAMVLLGRAQSEGVPDKVRGRVRIPSPITHEELSSMIGTTRESVVAAMRKLEDIVTRNNKTYTVDIAGLKRTIEE